ncbi:MAG: ROK family transcriptional regulator [Clostridia bacterium]|jgi:predicted NBD/HSP70 family sugar kinase|nr:ROK family transcriptional regulator [Clostridia bacterium]MBT7122519.1 ROK family transcriptional regulator [Clostridia bacterium]
MSNYSDDKGYTKTDQSFLKNYNITKVLNILRQYERLSRIELSAVSSLDKKTITNITKRLLEDKQIEVVEYRYEGMGRPKAMLGLRGDYCKCIGLDLGGKYISGVIIDFTGAVVCSHNVDIFSRIEPEMLIKISYNIIDNLLKKAKISMEEVNGIGISIPGFIDKETGMAILSENIPLWSTVPLEKIFSEKYNKPVYIDNNSRLMAVAELWYGKGRDQKDFLSFDLGLGIGCGIVINHNVYEGGSGKSGEVGHTIVEVDGPLCTCGRHGCIESLASGWALDMQVQEAIKKGVPTLLTEMKSGEGSSATKADIRLAAELGDEFSIKLLERAGEYIGIGVANAIDLFNPTLVIINGTLVADNEVLMNAIRKTVEEQTMPQIYSDVKIVESEIGVLASAIGAATLCLEKSTKTE